MQFTKWFNLKATSQRAPIPGTSQVRNSNAGYSWAVDDWARLDRFLILGSEGGSYYATERKLTRDNAEAVLRCIAADGHSEQATVSRCDLTEDCCIVLGSEGYGLSPAALEVCNEAVAIPMANTVDSLNVGNAGAIFLYEANRQRGAM